LFFLEKKFNIKTQERIRHYHTRIELMKKKLNMINRVLQSSHDETQKNIVLRTTQDDQLRVIRLQRMDELHKYIFPIERVTRIEE
jgi:hypothetical protein